MNKTLFVLFFTFCLIHGPLKAMEPTRVILYSDDGNPPYAMSDKGHAYGLYIDLIKEISKEMPEYKIEIVPVPWSRGLNLLRTGDIFALIGPYKINERKYLIYSSPIYEEKVAAFCNEEIKKNKFDFPHDFYKLSNGINSGFILSDTFSKLKRDSNFKLEEATSTETNVRKLLYKRIDCYFNDQLSTMYSLNLVKQKDPQIRNKQINEVLILSKQNAYIGFTKNLDKYSYRDNFVNKFDSLLLKFQKSKRYKDLINHYSN